MIQSVLSKKRSLTSKAAKAFYPLQPKICVAVTGTNGKTSVASYVKQFWGLLEMRAVSLGTVGIEPTSAFKEALPEVPSITTPGATDLHRILDDLAKKKCEACVLEASSHGLDQCRLHEVHLSAAGFTNLSQDHLDYHQSLEAYFKAKEKLFTEVSSLDTPCVINIDCAYGKRLAFERGLKNVMTYSLKDPSASLYASNVKNSSCGISFDLFYKQALQGSYTIPIFGEFHISNILCALGLAIASTKVQAQDVFTKISHLKSVLGRLEVVPNDLGYKIFVDYAHTPDALEKALKALKMLDHRKFFTVFGCGGDRDKSKRPLMGKIAHDLADEIIITDDNPRTEDPEIIRKDVAALLKPGTYHDCGDRKKAIAFALSQMKQGDILLIAGKGHESGQTVGTVTLSFHDVTVTKELLDVISSPSNVIPAPS